MIEDKKISIFNALRWGFLLHELVASTAQQLLTPKASTEVEKLLSKLGIKSLKEIAIWADKIKHSNLKDEDSIQFIKDYPDRGGSWHYVNLPLGATEYSRDKYSGFTRDDDVVQMISKTTKVLKGDLKIMSKINALRWITHLVGDVHQPVHVGCGYLDYSSSNPELVFDPAVIEKDNLESDRGGNALVLPLGINSKDVSLHEYWDSKLFNNKPSENVTEAPGVYTEKELIDEILGKITRQKTDRIVISPSDIINKPVDKWAESWATDTLLMAREAYEKIEIDEKIAKEKFRIRWEGIENYERRCKTIVSKQVELAAERLAEILNEIFV